MEVSEAVGTTARAARLFVERGDIAVTGLPTAILGRTGIEVTTLGYGASELRGGALGPAIILRMLAVVVIHHRLGLAKHLARRAHVIV